MKRRQRMQLAHVGFGIGLLAISCSSTEQWQRNQEQLAIAASGAEGGNLRQVNDSMQMLLNETQKDAEDFELQRFFAAFLLAQVHSAASLGEEYLTEVSTARSVIGGGIGGTRTRSNTSPSTTRHILTALYHASLARSWYSGAARSSPMYEDVTLLPPDFANLGVDNADANLAVILATSLSRLNFDGRVRAILDESPPALFELEGCLAALDRYGVQQELRPWVALMIFQHLKDTNEEEAFRFAVNAVEGLKRFGYALPPDEVDAIDAWITGGAKSEFVCPTDREISYLPKVDRCPVCATPHLEYIAVERTP